MRYMHSLDMMHRDLKPQNIFLDEDWHAVIGDLGLGRSGEASRPPSAGARTGLYAAAEQLYATVMYTKKVDVFAFGLIVYEVITGHPAFYRNDCRKLPAVPREYGQLMESLIRRCWAMDPSLRPSFAEIFDEFAACDFALFPDVDSAAIAEYVSEVIAIENGSGVRMT
jgi:serine/threonine protein kinase